MQNRKSYYLDRVAIRLVRDDSLPLMSSRPLNTVESVIVLLHEEIFRDMDRECFAVLNLKNDGTLAGIHPLSVNICSVGCLNNSIIHPREVVKSTILSNAASVILIHNHPSGRIEPSQEDIAVTDQLVKAYALLGINVLDHIILGPKEQYYSFYERKELPIVHNEFAKELDQLEMRPLSLSKQKSDRNTKKSHKIMER